MARVKVMDAAELAPGKGALVSVNDQDDLYCCEISRPEQEAFQETVELVNPCARGKNERQ